MRKILLFMLLSLNILFLFADGRQEREKQSFKQLQIRIINRSGEPVVFYFDTVYAGITINDSEEFITRKIALLQTDNYRALLGFKYNNGETFFYRFHNAVGEQIAHGNMQVTAIVEETHVSFFDTLDFDKPVDYSARELSQRHNQFRFLLEADIEGNGIDINLTNNSESEKTLVVYGVIDDQFPYSVETVFETVSFTAEKNKTYPLADDLPLYFDIKIEVYESYNCIDEIIIRNHQHKNVTIIINNKGHEIEYY